MSHACAKWRGDIGAYVIGVLDDQERARVTRHLARCPGCRAEYDDLLPVRDWLARLAGTGAAPVPSVPMGGARAPLPWAQPANGTPLPEPRPAWLHAKRSRTRRHSLAALATLAGAAAVAGLAVIFSPSTPTYQALDRATGVQGRAQLHATPAGTRIDLTITGLPGGERCTLVAVSPGRTDIAGTWDETYDGPARVWGTSALRLGQLTALRVEMDTGKLLLRIPVGTQHPAGSAGTAPPGTQQQPADGRF